MSIQEHLQRKRAPLDTWDTKEKHCLASVVMRNGERDQNWSAVSRFMKTVGYPSRPTDWYSPKNCAAQYGLLLETAESPKRKKRISGAPNETQIVDTPVQSIFRRKKEERIAELQKLMNEMKCTFAKLKQENDYVRSGRATFAEVVEICRRIENEKKQKEKEAQQQAKWLKEREEKKLELEKQWRTSKPVAIVSPGQKRKINEGFDGTPDNLSDESMHDNKPAISPLLTSLLKSPSPAPTTNASFLHSAMQQVAKRTSPAIASLLNTSQNDVNVGLQHLVGSGLQHDTKLLSPVSTNVAPPILAVIENNLLSQNSVPHIAVPPEEDTTQWLEDLEEIINSDVKVINDSSCLSTNELPKEKESKIAEYLELDKVEKVISQQQTQQMLIHGNSPLKSTDMPVTPCLQSPIKNETDNSLQSVVQEIENISKAILAKEGLDAKNVMVPSHSGGKDMLGLFNQSKQENFTHQNIEMKLSQTISADVVPKIETTGLSSPQKVEKLELEREIGSPKGLSSRKIEKVEGAIKATVKDSKDTKSSRSSSDRSANDKSEVNIEQTVKETSSKVISPSTKSPPLLSNLNKHSRGDSVKEESTSGNLPIKNDEDTSDNLPLIEFKHRDSVKNEIDVKLGKLNKMESLEVKKEEETKAEKIDVEKMDLDTDETIKTEPMDVEEEVQKALAVGNADDSTDLYDEVGVLKSDGNKRDYSRKKELVGEEIEIVLPLEKDDDKDVEDDTSQGISDESTQASDQSKFLHKKDFKSKARFDSCESTDEESQTSNTLLTPILSVAKRRQSSLQMDSKPNSPDCMSISSGTEDHVDTKEYRAWKKSIMLLYNTLCEYRSSALFLRPITDDQAPRYHETVKKPRDLQTLKKLLENGQIRTTDEFIVYALLMVQNAIMYNKMYSPVFQLAKEAQTEYIHLIQRYVEAQTPAETPLRRETRTQVEPIIKKTPSVDTPGSIKRKKK